MATQQNHIPIQDPKTHLTIKQATAPGWVHTAELNLVPAPGERVLKVQLIQTHLYKTPVMSARDISHPLGTLTYRCHRFPPSPWGSTRA